MGDQMAQKPPNRFLKVMKENPTVPFCESGPLWLQLQAFYDGHVESAVAGCVLRTRQRCFLAAVKQAPGRCAADSRDWMLRMVHSPVLRACLYLSDTDNHISLPMVTLLGQLSILLSLVVLIFSFTLFLTLLTHQMLQSCPAWLAPSWWALWPTIMATRGFPCRCSARV